MRTVKRVVAEPDALALTAILVEVPATSRYNVQIRVSLELARDGREHLVVQVDVVGVQESANLACGKPKCFADGIGLAAIFTAHQSKALIGVTGSSDDAQGFIARATIRDQYLEIGVRLGANAVEALPQESALVQ